MRPRPRKECAYRCGEGEDNEVGAGLALGETLFEEYGGKAEGCGCFVDHECEEDYEGQAAGFVGGGGGAEGDAVGEGVDYQAHCCGGGAGVGCIACVGVLGECVLGGCSDWIFVGDGRGAVEAELVEADGEAGRSSLSRGVARDGVDKIHEDEAGD